MKVFVYGTLKRGGYFHSVLADQLFVATATTVKRFRLFSLGNYPGMIEANDETEGYGVQGEVWEVNAGCLRKLDELEEVDKGEYKRSKIGLLPPHSELDVQGYIYLGDVSELEEVGACW